MVVEGNLPLSFAENLEWLSFCQTFFPHVSIPSRKILTTRILRDELLFWCTKAQMHSKGQLVTLQVDRWTGLNYHHYLGFMITSQNEVCLYFISFCFINVLNSLKVHSIRVVNTSNQRKTAEILLEHTERIKALLEKEWNFTIVAFTTDASDKSRKARSLFVKKYPQIVGPDCSAHQVFVYFLILFLSLIFYKNNLIVGDYFKAGDPLLLGWSTQASELISWLRSKTYILAHLREIQTATGSAP